MLYLSLYLKTNRARYYQLLQKVRVEGVWKEGLAFFLQGMVQTANQACETGASLRKLFREDSEKIYSLGRTAGTATQVHLYLQSNPISAIASIATKISKSVPAVTSALGKLEELGIVREGTGRKRDRIFF